MGLRLLRLQWLRCGFQFIFDEDATKQGDALERCLRNGAIPGVCRVLMSLGTDEASPAGIDPESHARPVCVLQAAHELPGMASPFAGHL